MFDSVDTSTERLALFAAAGMVLMLWCAVGLAWMIRRDVKSRRLRRRIGLYDEPQPETPTRTLSLWREGEADATLVVPHTTWLHRKMTHLRRLPQDAGWDLSIWLIIPAVIIGMVMVGLTAWLLTHSTTASVAIAFMACAAFSYLMQHQIQKRREAFERQFEDAMNLIARSLRAGQPLLGAFQLVSDELDPPVSNVFNEICQQQALGLSLEEAVRRVAAVHQNHDLNLFATAVVIQLRTGGNLADMMQRFSHIIRERLRLLRRVRVLTAQTQYSKRVLLVLPLFMFVMLTAMNPKYMDPMYATTIGRFLSAAAVVSMLMGAWMMNRMARVQD